MSGYRADQVGSLLRPPRLLEARAAYRHGSLAIDRLREVEDQAILQALDMQRQVGLDVLTDGEYRRDAYLSDMAEAVAGFVEARVGLEWRGSSSSGGEQTTAALAVGEKLRQVRRLTAHESGFLRQRAPGPFKITVPSPVVFATLSYKPGLTDRVYPRRADLLRDLVPIVRDEIRALVEEGVPYVQLDAPRYTHFVDQRLREQVRQSGDDPDRLFEEAVAADVACLEGIQRSGVTLAMHICRGNSRSRWLAEGGYDPIAERLFGSLPVDRFLLEYDSDRAGGFQPLRFVPKGKTVVLGLITSKRGQLEPVDNLSRRIEEAAQYVPIERLAISPQCGFASVAEGNLLTADEQRRKLELVAEVARKVWG